GRSSSCPGGLPGLEEDSYLKLRSDFLREFKSMSALFQRCQPAPEVGLRRSTADEQQSNSLPMVYCKSIQISSTKQKNAAQALSH
ncbi:hypothetical protein EFP47_15965, partial [Lactiplantibacillus pentosus]|uniref:hypothetical protein n=1 Tax=Lactiplantibacillus pentosus TaxID=1589 RepID=UPI0021A4743E